MNHSNDPRPKLFSSRATQTTFLWVAILYFAEGFPFGLFFDAMPVYFRIHGVSLQEIGLMSAAGLAWTFKVLWAPAVDAIGQRRSWIVSCQVLLALCTAAFIAVHPEASMSAIWVLLVTLSVLSATQDIAIDAYTIELLDEKQLGIANGIRVAAYRMALIGSGGLFVVAAGVTGWNWAFLGTAILIGIYAVICSRAPMPQFTRREITTVTDAIVAPIRQLSRTPGFLFVVFFILTFKLGDMAMGPMVKPFWVDREFTPVQIGLVPGTVGVVCTIAGAMIGGVYTSRWGIFTALWVFGLLQAVSNLVYAGVAAMPASVWLMYIASVVESITAGLGTAPFMALLMRLCDKSHAATQFSLLSALFGFSRSISGMFSGWGAESLGYSTYFALTFFIALPAFALLPWIRQALEARQWPGASSDSFQARA